MRSDLPGKAADPDGVLVAPHGGVGVVLAGRRRNGAGRTFAPSTLAGIRVGYCVASLPLAQLVRKVGVARCARQIAKHLVISAATAKTHRSAHLPLRPTRGHATKVHWTRKGRHYQQGAYWC